MLFRLFSCVVAAAIAMVAAVASPAAAAPALWAVRDADSTIYLFGTVHVLPEGTDWRTDAYDKAYAEAHTVWLEADLSKAEEAADQMLLRGFDGEHKLSKKMSRKDFRRTVAALAPFGLDRKQVDRMRPWMAGLMILGKQYASAGLSAEAGADMSVMAATEADAKQTRFLETLGEQIDIFADMSPEAEMQWLLDALDGGEAVAEETDEAIDAWLDGSLEDLDAELVQTLKQERPAMYEALFRDRNLAWADTLSEEMKGSGVHLVNIGAAHLLGDEGLPSLMRQRGFTVERVQ